MDESPRHQISANLAFTLIKSASVLVSIRLADAVLTAQVMGLILLLRRQGALWSNLVQLGLSQSLQKFYVADERQAERLELWGVMVRWVAVASTVFVTLCLLIDDSLANLLFGRPEKSLAWGFGIYVAGIALGFMATSSWQAEFRFVRANLIDWMNGSLLFIVCLIWAGHLPGTSIVFILSGLTLAASLLAIWSFASMTNGRNALFANRWRLERSITRYGYTRALTAFADLATMVLGPWLLRGQSEQAGYLIVALIVVRVAQSLVLPVARVLALRANSYRYNQHREEQLILKFAGIVFVVSWLFVALYFGAGDIALAWWLPNSSAHILSIVDKLVLFLPAIGVFYALRNHIEIRYTFPFNLVFLVCAIATLLISSRLLGPVTLTSITNAMSHMFFAYYFYSAAVVVVLARRKPG